MAGPVSRGCGVLDDFHHLREIPVLAITDDERSPLATHSAHSFKVFDNAVRRFRPLSPSIVLAQTLIMGLGYLKDRKKLPL